MVIGFNKHGIQCRAGACSRRQQAPSISPNQCEFAAFYRRLGASPRPTVFFQAHIMTLLTKADNYNLYCSTGRGWCSAQRVRIYMVAGGNHTIIYPKDVSHAPGFVTNWPPGLPGKLQFAQERAVSSAIIWHLRFRLFWLTYLWESGILGQANSPQRAHKRPLWKR